MRVKGINKAYFVEIGETKKGVAITLGCLTGQMMGVVVSKEGWKRIKNFSTK